MTTPTMTTPTSAPPTSAPPTTEPARPPVAVAPRPFRNFLQARNEQGVRTVVTTNQGLGLVTDEPVARGGTGTAPTPLETVIGALCGCSAVTFERAAKELAFSYEGIEFDAAFTLDRRGLLGEATVRPHFQTVDVEARVRTAESHQRLATVVEVTESRCPVRNLLVDAGVALAIDWVPVPPLP
jgi:uncharacterized OsmC-like protein